MEGRRQLHDIHQCNGIVSNLQTFLSVVADIDAGWII